MTARRFPAGTAATLVPIDIGEILRLAAQERAAGRLAEAEALLAAARTADPDSAAVGQEMALVAFQQGRLAEAEALSRQALAACPERAEWWRNRCTIVERGGDYPAALEAARRAVALDPASADHWYALAMIAYRMRDAAASIAHARAALARDSGHAGAHVLLGEALLLTGDFAAGWEEYAWRFRLPGAPPVAPAMGCPAWNGALLPGGRLLLVADQGYGDAIQFARYIPWAAGRCGAVTLLVAPELAPLLAPLVPGGDVRTGWDQVLGASTGLAAWIPLSELPRLAGTRADNIPATGAYLAAEPGAVAAWRARLDAIAPRPARRVGLVWAGRPTHPNDASRSAPPESLTALARVPGVTLIGLQHGPAAAGWAALGPPETALGAAIADFPAAAAAIAAVDLLIAVDSAPAHLAGALGRAVWTMLPFGPDWRWGEGRGDSPWYPAMRLFRPDRPRGWRGLAASVAAALQDSVEQGKNG